MVEEAKAAESESIDWLKRIWRRNGASSKEGEGRGV